MIKQFLSQCGWVDIALVVFLVWGGAVGFKNGLLKEIPRLISSLAAIVLSLNYYKRLGEKVAANSFVPLFPAEMISFVLIILVTLIAARFLFRVLENLVTATCVRPLDVGGGMFLGAVRYFLLFAIISYGLLMFTSPYLHESYSFRSLSGPFIEQVCDKIYVLTVRFIPLP